MQNTALNLNQTLLLELMQDFYILTGIRIVIFDSTYHEILAWPASHCPFCQLMHDHELTRAKCAESDAKSFQRCKQKSELEIYHCHAGLVEATAPLIDNDMIIGYIMFGQISDLSCEQESAEMLKAVLACYQPDVSGRDVPESDDTIFRVTHKTSQQILAAAKILEACTSYVLLKDMITLQRRNFITNLNTFLLEHLSEDLSIERLMNEFHVSRNKLYDSANEYLGIGIAEHIKALRMKEARRLLKETDLAIQEIADKVGFNDYNYFCRTFKKEAGMPAKQYRKHHRP
ncbi:MAG: PocR ligand-binding domain-containing protein [Lachnospiraceae bacterium]|nr:PocR ligand-binding domain-containing protein [Lachnospiraceae bacterium]